MKKNKSNNAIYEPCFHAKSITIKLNLESILEKYAPDNPEYFQVSSDSTLADLLKYLGLSEDQVMLAFVNGKLANLKTRLSDRDSVSLCPYICGG
ncbi:thiamineS protein [Desulfonatronospira thiodismutans ASO3-1]|uniref:ThiamineS protein n=1 Tax=Desulfonatronospira thiodismutans ASO3-1 TaxID=555779 RepID=D6SP25_9BACT|nr:MULTISPECIES: MoaD/ThiS family protein [Desulfonatronospira]EFI34501.1 thiamineS protein [Desulfonatronospira thiodismutans ASO3-1]RQD73364.1 MAG: thiamine S protein [Desulfonatronospira sp. MSAO_Bac3]